MLREARYIIDKDTYEPSVFKPGDMIRCYRQGVGIIPAIAGYNQEDQEWTALFIGNSPRADDFMAMFLGVPSTEDLKSYILQTTPKNTFTLPPIMYSLLWEEKTYLVSEDTLDDWFYVCDPIEETKKP